MLNALKKLRQTGRSDVPAAAQCGVPHASVGVRSGEGVRAMSAQLQRRFGRGVQYNMRVVIRGDSSVGKTCLFERLQGRPFCERYTPTPQLQAASIQWSYRVTDDVVKVDVWDVVDCASSRHRRADQQHGSPLKLSNDSGGSDEAAHMTAALDAQFLDVYKGTDCVIMMLDVSKPWTLDYVRRHAADVPAHLPLLILGNHCDTPDRQVRADDVRWLAAHLRCGDAWLDAGETTDDVAVTTDASVAPVFYGEACMRNGFGLRLVHRFLNVPFLRVQRAGLRQQLAANRLGMAAARDELLLYEHTAEADYEAFISGRPGSRMSQSHSAASLSSSTTTTAAASCSQTTAAVDARTLSHSRSAVLSVQAADNSNSSGDGDGEQSTVCVPPSSTSAVVARAGAVDKAATNGAGRYHDDDDDDDAMAQFVPDLTLDAEFLQQQQHQNGGAAELATEADTGLDVSSHDEDENEGVDGRGPGINPLVVGFDETVEELAVPPPTTNAVLLGRQGVARRPVCVESEDEDVEEHGDGVRERDKHQSSGCVVETAGQDRRGRRDTRLVLKSDDVGSDVTAEQGDTVDSERHDDAPHLPVPGAYVSLDGDSGAPSTDDAGNKKQRRRRKDKHNDVDGHRRKKDKTRSSRRDKNDNAVSKTAPGNQADSLENFLNSA